MGHELSHSIGEGRDRVTVVWSWPHPDCVVDAETSPCRCPCPDCEGWEVG